MDIIKVNKKEDGIRLELELNKYESRLLTRYGLFALLEDYVTRKTIKAKGGFWEK